jgi:hypothetical protein
LARLQAQKNRICPGLRFCPLVGVSMLRMTEHNQVGRSVSRHGANTGPNHQVNLTAYSPARFWYIGFYWHRGIINIIPAIRRTSFFFVMRINTNE